MAHCARRRERRGESILLATARVRVLDRCGQPHFARALIDQGSEASMISESLTQRLRLPRSRVDVAVFGVGGQQSGTAKGKVSLQILSHFSSAKLNVTALILPRLTAYRGELKQDFKTLTYLHDVTLADPELSATDQIDIILGADVYANLVRPGLRRGGPRDPVAQDTVLGWILSGRVKSNCDIAGVTVNQCVVGEPLFDVVRRFWEQEELPFSPPPMTDRERECEEHFAQTHIRDSSGRYAVRLPVKSSLPNLFFSRGASARVQAGQEARFNKNATFANLYKDFMREYEDLGHMAPVEPLTFCVQACYLPHHGVLREASTTTKLRVVFNGSAANREGDCLNNHLLAGPNLLPPLADVILRWHRHRYVLSGDIEKMYRQIRVQKEDCDLQRILWREKPSEPLRDYWLLTVTYGLACAPFLAIRTLRQLATDEEERFPSGAAVLRRDVYVDDILTGADTVEEVLKLKHELINLCRAEGFPLRKWAANEPALLLAIPERERLRDETRTWGEELHPMLGIQWRPDADEFTFVVKPLQTKSITKRAVLAQSARLFDPLGWLAPITVRAKIFMQATWLLQLEWDAPLAVTEADPWREFVKELPLLEHLRIPRWLQISSQTKAELHGFSDASERAYAAAIYLRTHELNQHPQVRLIMAKTKVAPLKQVSLPRLELCAAALLSKLSKYAQAVLDLGTADVHLWTDSTVILAWIQGPPHRWTTFVANRMAQVQSEMPAAKWHHLPGKWNPADCASRGIALTALIDHPLWWQGLPWLSRDQQEWPSSREPPVMDPPERRSVHIGTTFHAQPEEPELLARFSSFSRLLRVTAWCLRWKGRNKTGTSYSPHLTAEELANAEATWIKNIQNIYFCSSIMALQANKAISRGTLTHLNPFMDASGLLRVGGRLEHSMLSFDEKHPLILPGSSLFTRLLVESCHKKTLHGGTQQTLGLMRRRFWVPQGRRIVKSCIGRCVTCVRWRAETARQQMGNLPANRVRPSKPFLFTGVDYAGPIHLRTAPGRGQKAYKGFLMVFVCLSTKAVHLDVASNYSADAFLAAFRRFTARRGLCRELISDCGTTFVGVDAQLQRLFQASSREAGKIADALAEDRIRWRFIPPAVPHFGGLWEAAVKSAKHHLRRVLGDHTLTYEEMATLVLQVEACLNSRPLQALSDDPDDVAALTPGHFIIGTALNALPEPDLLNVPALRLSRWQLLQQMRDHFWARWSCEYLHGLLPRGKWAKDEENVAVGRLCLIMSEITRPTRWPLARITALHPGDDGGVHVVTVRTAGTELRRPIHKLVLLPGGPEEESA